MPAIPPNQLVPGTAYTMIRRAQPRHLNGYGHSRTFLRLSGNGWPIFRTNHGAAMIENPETFDFYLPNDNTIPGGSTSTVGPIGAGASGGKSRKNRKNKQTKKRKTNRKNKSRKH